MSYLELSAFSKESTHPFSYPHYFFHLYTTQDLTEPQQAETATSSMFSSSNAALPGRYILGSGKDCIEDLALVLKANEVGALPLWRAMFGLLLITS